MTNPEWQHLVIYALGAGGGSRGIGSAIAKRLAADGATVAITYAGNKAAADATVAAIEGAGGGAFAFQADATDPASQQAGVEQAAAALGGSISSCTMPVWPSFPPSPKTPTTLTTVSSAPT